MRPTMLLVCLVLSSTALAQTPRHVGGHGRCVVLVTGPEADDGLYQWDDGGGLAPYLARRGHSVWIASGDALAGAIHTIVEDEGTDRVALVGHGLGGTACLRYLAEAGDEAPLTAVVILGAPTALAPSSPLRGAVFDVAAHAGVDRWSLLALHPSPLPAGGDDLFSAGMTTSDEPVALLARAREAGAVQRHPAMDDLQGWLEAAPLPGACPYPVLLACAELDRMAPCEEAWRVRDRTDGTFHKFGYMNLDGPGPGHLDLVLADDARRRVFPVVARFLRQQGAR